MQRESVPCLVILKRVEMPPEDERRQRAVEEVQLATRLRHPSIVQVYELVEHQGEPYVVMELSPGLFLATAMRVPPERARVLRARACELGHSRECEPIR